MRDVYVLGIGMIKFGRYPDKDVSQLAAEAALLALKDAGMTITAIQLLASGNLLQANAMVGQRILQQIGQTGIPIINVANACATGSTAIREAYFAIGSGEYDVVMAVGSEQMGKAGLLGGGGDRRESVEGLFLSGSAQRALAPVRKLLDFRHPEPHGPRRPDIVRFRFLATCAAIHRLTPRHTPSDQAASRPRSKR